MFTHMNPTLALIYSLLFAVCVIFLLVVIDKASNKFSCWFKAWREAKRIAKLPFLYECENNGVIGLVRACDYDAAVNEYWAKNPRRNDGMWIMYVVPNTMIFVNDTHRFKEAIAHRTGNMEDYKILADNCRIENRLFFVPFSTFVYNMEWQKKQYPTVDLNMMRELVPIWE
jgi:hypothetical protein